MRLAQNGHVDYFSATRHKDVLLCAVGALAVYFFARFYTTDEGFPAFTNFADWYGVKAFPAHARNSDNRTTMSYDAHYKQVKKAHDELNIRSKKVTHANRGVGARWRELAGCVLSLVMS